MRSVALSQGLLKATGRILAAVTLGLTVSGFTSAESLFAPSADLWERWQAHDPNSAASVDYGDWDRLLAAYLRPTADGVNLFDYAAITAADRAALQSFLDQMAAVPISRYPRPEQRAYWMNLYNALTVQVVLDNYPVDSIRDIDISPGLFADGPWDKELIIVEGEALTLNDIEHRILRPIWQDPRIHYAVNCASIGCPNLRSEAYTAANSEAMLEAGARDYINDPRGVTVAGGRVTVSKIYDWFHEDFGSTAENVIAHLTRYAEPGLAAEIEAIGDIHDTAYDWSLNAVR